MAEPNPHVLLQTTLGDIELELFPAEAPVTVANFLQYVDDGHYEGTIFHRVIPKFMIQGGGMTSDMEEKPTREPIKNEATNRRPHKVGTIAMARTSEPHSASAQFFINVKNNDFLNHKSTKPDEFGYCVFGQVVQGYEVCEQIVAVPTQTVGRSGDVPVTPVVILAAARR